MGSSLQQNSFTDKVNMQLDLSDKGKRELPDTRTRMFTYVIITPVRNEELNIEETVHSVAAQTVLPTEWIIVNDGSTDRTGELLDQFCKAYPWLHVIHLTDRGFREPGSGVIRSFNDGLRNLKTQDWEYLVKLDGDLSFAPDYFEKCLEEFRRDPKLAVGGGTIYHNEQDHVPSEPAPRFHVRGATKIYRRAFWDAAGEIPPVTGWDTIDEVKANMLGWTTRSFPEIRILHRRPTGSADGAWRNWYKNGRANYITGYHPLFMLLKCVKRLPERPYVLAGVGLFCGFASGYLSRARQVDDKRLVQYVRSQQLRRLLFRDSIWK
jgi:biofilm PGA synthesis N-glycosyltransferase PgaC